MERSTTNTIFIRAGANIIYQAFANERAMETWMAPGNMVAKMHHFDWREGGSYEMSLYYSEQDKHHHGKTSDKEDRFHASITKLNAGHEIVQAIRFDSTDAAYAGEMILTVSLHTVPGGTEVTFTFNNIPAVIHPEDNEKGTALTLEKLKHYVEEGDVSDDNTADIDEQFSDGSANAFEDK